MTFDTAKLQILFSWHYSIDKTSVISWWIMGNFGDFIFSSIRSSLFILWAMNWIRSSLGMIVLATDSPCKRTIGFDLTCGRSNLTEEYSCDLCFVSMLVKSFFNAFVASTFSLERICLSLC